MSVICNVKIEPAGPEQPSPKPKSSTQGYDESEKYIESGSAYFSQAFAEALGLTSDLELHDLYRAELRLQTIEVLLNHALKEYEGALRLYKQTDLFDYHSRMLRESGLTFEGVQHVLCEAGKRDFLAVNEQLINNMATTFDRSSYEGLMNLYLDKVRSVYRLVSSPSVTLEPGAANGIAWQELGWKSITLFMQAICIGQAIAVLNTFTGRLSKEAR